MIKKILNEDRGISSLTLYSQATKGLGCKNTISFSQLDTYVSCPMKWYNAQVKRLKYDDPSIHMLYGSALHKLMFKWLRSLHESTIKASEEMDFHGMLLTYMQDEFKSIAKSGNKSFTTATELSTFHTYGMECMKFLVKHRAGYFSKKGYELVGLEYPMILRSEFNQNIAIILMMDILEYDIKREMYEITDVKTSMRGWDKDKKNSDSSKNQLLLYKDALIQEYKIPSEKIEAEYMIFRNTVPENSEYPVKRIQIVTPAMGKTTANKYKATMKNFVDTCFLPNGDRNPDISMYKKTDNDYNCRFCPYKKHNVCNGPGKN